MDDIDRLLIRHLNGVASAEEEEEIRRWIEADPEHEEQLQLLREAWTVSGTLPTGLFDQESKRYDTAGELERLLARIRGPERPPIPFPSRQGVAGANRRRWYASPLLRVAAVLAVILGTAVLLSTPLGPFFPTPLQRYATATGERTMLRLGDGSRIVLGPESELRLSSRFPREEREVQLEGTAYFEVAPDPERPFRVHAGGTVTRVLGTRFVVRAYAGDAAVEVGVAEGTVAVRADSDREEHGLVLTDGQIAQVDPQGTARVLHGASLDAILGWIEGRLVFRERPLDEVARELERWYDVEIRIADPELAAQTFTLSFHDAPLEEVLEIIAFSLGAEFEHEGRIITLFSADPEP